MSDVPSDDSLRSISLVRTSDGVYEATNAKGHTLTFGSSGHGLFTPVDLLLTAMAGCSAIDVDLITAKRVPADHLEVRMRGHKVRDEHGNHLVDLTMTFDVTFPDGEGGDAAREVLPAAVQRTHERLCTVSRTVELGAPIRVEISD
jgi:putative redox protein